MNATLYLGCQASTTVLSDAPFARDTHLEVTIDDLSRCGVHVQTPLPVAIDQPVAIGIAGIGRNDARVVRRTAAGFACEFVRPITPAAIRQAYRIDRDDWWGGPETAMPEPFVRKLPGALRLGIAVVFGLLGWGAVALLFGMSAR